MIASRVLIFCSRSLPLITSMVLLAANSPASAQTTINMTTVQGAPCVVVTDSRGLTSVDGSTDLQATGVSLTGIGCSPPNPPTSNNGLLLAATPAAPIAGVPFSVSWNVGNTSTCVGAVTAGTAANVVGWAQVTSATSPRAVTISLPGTYKLQLTCSNSPGGPQNTLVSPPLTLTVAANPPTSTNGLALVASPTAPTTGIAFSVSWNVSNAATCVGAVTAGTLANVAGWTTVSTTNSPRSVTISQPGSYTLQLTCSNPGGAPNSLISPPLAITVVGAPPSPPTSTDGLTLAAYPAAPTMAVPFSISWNVANASTCTGTVTAGTAANVTGWTTLSTVTSPRTVTISQAGNYTLQLTCANTGGSITSPPLQLVVSPLSACAGAPAGLTRILTTSVFYGAYTTPVRAGVDTTEWDNIWGHYSTTDTSLPWPGRQGSAPTLKNFVRTNFLAAHFRTGASSPTKTGAFTFPYNIAAPMIDMTVSTTCGSFTNASAGCIRSASGAGDNLLTWTFATTNQSKCILQANTDYYLNVKYDDPNEVTVACVAGSQACALPTLHNYTN